MGKQPVYLRNCVACLIQTVVRGGSSLVVVSYLHLGIAFFPSFNFKDVNWITKIVYMYLNWKNTNEVFIKLN